jgi:diguanylate cyclase (GGDEF)-like protein
LSQTDRAAKDGSHTRKKSVHPCVTLALQLGTLSLLVFVFSLIGIWSRPIGMLAALWPANAVLLAYLSRSGLSRCVLAYPVAWLSFIAADTLTGSSFAMASLLTLGNLMSVGAGLLYLAFCCDGQIRLSERTAMFHLVMTSVIASSTGGLLGVYAASRYFGDTPLEGFLYWSVTEFVNYIAFLPMLFAMPVSRLDWVRTWHRDMTLSHALPGLVTILLTILVVNLNNLNALVLPLLGLLWCAFVYSTFSTTLLTLFYCLQALLIVSGTYSAGADSLAGWIDLMLIRVSVSAVALVPVAISLYIQTTRSDVAELSYSANHDGLTGALSRRAFMDVLQRLLVDAKGKTVSLFVLDLDHFKCINDTHGHPVGDAAIIHFHNVVQQCLRAGDAVGRLGGEEFAVAFLQQNNEEPAVIAQRIHHALEELPLALEDGSCLPFTVSIGVASLRRAVTVSDSEAAAQTLIKQADEALYQAKANGRHQTVFYRPGINMDPVAESS